VVHKNKTMRGLIFCLLFTLTVAGFAQTSINQTDAMGKKQGLWVKKDRDGKKIYEATFRDGKPVGEMKRFYPNGKVMALMNFLAGSDTAVAQLFDESGSLMARGKYVDQKKTGEWTYFLDSKIVSTENYGNGLKEGPAKRFYKTGELLEESNWKNGHLDGLYRAYFSNGKVYLECNYSDGQRNGPFRIWQSDGTPELDASYCYDARDKDWKYFDGSGKIRFTLKFDKGKMLNPQVQDSIDSLNSKSFTAKDVPDPEKFMQNPEEYMRLMQKQ
jgi:antitoxin component YwqK of YwqJK toxin-antitoxin module